MFGDQFADDRAAHQAAMARQSMQDRFTPGSTAFLIAVVCDLMEQRFMPTGTALEGIKILRITIEDASGVVFPRPTRRPFPHTEITMARPPE